MKLSPTHPGSVVNAGAKTKSTRDDALDITKGILVVLMVAYHSINYSTQYFLAFRYMAFLPPTFIIITGFLLTRIYGTQSAGVSQIIRRLFLRGAKLLLLFATLNIGARSVQSVHDHDQTTGLRPFIVHWPDTFLIGSSRYAAFEILLPIAYLLIIAPMLLRLDRLHRWILPGIAIAAIIACVLAEKSGTSLPNLYLLSAGLIGMLLGRIAWTRLEALQSITLITTAAYSVYAVITSYIGQSFSLQLTGSVLSLAAIYGISLSLARTRQPGGLLTRLGHYSLFTYIVQIAILQIISRIFGRQEPFSAPHLIVAGATLLLTVGSAEIVHWMRKRLSAADYIYKAIFP